MQQVYYKANGFEVYRYIMPGIESNMYVLIGMDETAIVVDPNINERALDLFRDKNVKSIIVLLTHEHFDHVSGVNWLRGLFETKVICHAKCAEAITDPTKNMAKYWEIMMSDKPENVRLQGEAVKDLNYVCQADESFTGSFKFSWNGRVFRLQEAPGHSPGGAVIFVDDEIVFSGDNLVEGTGVICRWPGGNKRDYFELTRPMLESLKDDVLILPGHGESGHLPELRQYLELFFRKR